MQIADILTPSRISISASISSKKGVLEELARMIAEDKAELTQTEIFDSLCARERLGSTGLGHGVAIPHGRLKGNKQTLGAFIQLRDGIDYDAVDQQPVDLLFALLVPEESTDEHLQILARLAELFSDADLLRRLRHSSSSDRLFRLLNESDDQT